jgi:hypothetical protein
VEKVFGSVDSAWEFVEDGNEIALPSKQGSLHNWKISKEHSNSRYASSFSYSIVYNYEGNRHKSLKITKICIFKILDKSKPNTENIRRVNLVDVRYTTAQVTKLSS